MSKIFVRFGHEKLANGLLTGTNGIIHEQTAINQYATALVEMLQFDGHTVKTFKPYNGEYSTYNQGLAAGTKAANDWGADLFISCHANASNTHTGHGTEVMYGTSRTKALAQNIAKRMSAVMGTTLRRDGGAFLVDTSRFNDLREPKMPAVIIEAFFCDNQSDCDKFNKVNKRDIADAISRGIGVSGY